MVADSGSFGASRDLLRGVGMAQGLLLPEVAEQMALSAKYKILKTSPVTENAIVFSAPRCIQKLPKQIN